MLAGILFVFLFSPGPALAAGTWSYGITGADTPEVIDPVNTSAVVDTAEREIRLAPLAIPNVADFYGSGFEYAVVVENGVRSFAFDGSQMVENPLISVTGVTNPLALALPSPVPDVVVASGDRIKHYVFTGSGMTETPALAISGLTGLTSVAVGNSGEIAALAGQEIKRYLFDGSGMTEIPFLAPAETLSSPLAVAAADSYDLAVLEPERARYFSFDGSGMVENPLLTVAGLSGAVAFDVSGHEMAIVEGNEVRHYSFDGSGMSYNAALAVTEGLNKPTAVAIRPGSSDRLIVDGTEVKYYSFDGNGMVYNPALSVTVEDILSGNGYRKNGIVTSQVFSTDTDIDHIRVRAFQNIPNGTTVTWSVTADGVNWNKRWRVRGTDTGTVAEVTGDNGSTWETIGDVSDVHPDIENRSLWAQVHPGSKIQWKAELETADKEVTPKIFAQGGLAVRWEADSKPDMPVLDPVPGWYYTTTPTFSWRFSDPDPGDTQSAFQVIIRRASDDEIIFDSGEVDSGETTFRLPTSGAPNIAGPLWSAGEYEFTIEIRTFDSFGVPSEFSSQRTFKVLAFERPRIAEIVSAPAGQPKPVLADPSTHLIIPPGMSASALPQMKAGSKVTLILDSVGPLNTVAGNIFTFPYGAGKEAVIGEALAQYPLGNGVNRWTISFWTEASLDTVPTGTLIGLKATGTGTEGGTTNFWTEPGAGNGTFNYADGLVQTSGSVYEDWCVILQGSAR